MITLDFVPNEDRISPPTPASFSMMMLANTAFRAMPSPWRSTAKCSIAAGFGAREIMDVPMSAQQLVVASA